jgi:hypothetical protein
VGSCLSGGSDGAGAVAAGGGWAPPRYHDTTHTPVALYNFDGVITDSSGNARDLTLEAGTSRFSRILGLRGFYFDGSTRLFRNAADAGLRITGDMTLEMVMTWDVDPPGTGVNADVYPVSHGGDSALDDTPNNFLYSVYGRTPSVTEGLRYFAEGAAGVNIIHDIDDPPAAVGAYHHLALVRSSDDVTFYCDGIILGVASVGLAAPTDGVDGRLRVGGLGDGTPGRHWTGIIASLKIIGSALTAGQVETEYDRTLGIAP